MKVYTTGQVAKICKVAPRTVSKWFDSGHLKGYRIPGSQDRRIPHENLIKFLKENGMPTEDVDNNPTRLLFSTDTDLIRKIRNHFPDIVGVCDLFHAGVEYGSGKHSEFIVDMSSPGALGFIKGVESSRLIAIIKPGDERVPSAATHLVRPFEVSKLKVA